MRTVTFSNAEVAKAVNSRVLPTWLNRKPGFHNCELKTEARILVEAFECYPTRNFCTFFTTPDLDVLHYFSGYYSPRLFLEELRFVDELAGAVLDDKRRLIPGKIAKYAEMHELHRRLRAEESKKVSSMLPPKSKEGGVEPAERFHERRANYAEGLRHLADVHRDLAKRAVRDGKPVALGKVLTDYLFGNPFTEEGKEDMPDGGSPKK